MRLLGTALFLLGCGSSFSAGDGPRGGAGSAGEGLAGSAGLAGAGGTAGEQAGSGGAQMAGAGSTGGAGNSGETAAGNGGRAGDVAGTGGEPPMGGSGGSAGEPMAGMAGMDTAGAAGAEQCGLAYGSPGYKTIDDLEDGDGIVGNGERDPEPPARFGIWSAGNSSPGLCLQTTGELTPEEDGDGNLAATTSGFDCLEAWVAFDLHRCGDTPKPYDVSTYAGLTFRYRGAAVRVVVVVDPSWPPAESRGKGFAAAESWTQASVTWEELRGDQVIGTPPMKPQPTGEPRAFDVESVIGVMFVSGGPDVELWVDDVSFL